MYILKLTLNNKYFYRKTQKKLLNMFNKEKYMKIS